MQMDSVNNAPEQRSPDRLTDLSYASAASAIDSVVTNVARPQTLQGCIHLHENQSDPMPVTTSSGTDSGNALSMSRVISRRASSA